MIFKYIQTWICHPNLLPNLDFSKPTIYTMNTRNALSSNASIESVLAIDTRKRRILLLTIDGHSFNYCPDPVSHTKITSL